MKNKIPFAIETLSGKQYRCGVCGKIYFNRDELEVHLQKEKIVDYKNLRFPELDRNVTISLIYTQDIRDLTNPKYPKLVKGDSLFEKRE
ncbi:C2H2-type zinc finger protein [Melioribacteraceae bacterium 4301-Me]|uniref:C2H2-type zinc finger protein n=1 Tax=Pyranulibacter aquaticus TaxID=3163344 RepID=UPI0035960CCE